MIPSHVKIGGFIYPVETVKNLASGRSRFAEFSPMDGVIRIDDCTTETKREESLLHEVLEAINIHCELGLEHNVIQTLAFQLHQVLKDNNLRFGEEKPPGCYECGALIHGNYVTYTECGETKTAHVTCYDRIKIKEKQCEE